jgi:hypothetical protein
MMKSVNPNCKITGLKLLRLQRVDNYELDVDSKELEFIDSVCDEIASKKVRKRNQTKEEKAPTLVEEDCSIKEENKSEADSPKENLVDDLHSKLPSKKRKFISIMPYVESPDSVLGTLEIAARVYASKHKSKFINEKEYAERDTHPTEVVQSQQLLELSTWRKLTMERLKSKFKHSEKS